MTTLPQSPSSWPRWFPSLTQKQEHIWECPGGLCHTELCHGVVAAQEKKGGEGQRHEGEGGGERREAKLPLCKPPLPTARSAHWEGAGARVPGRSAPVPSQGCGAQLHKPPGPGATAAAPAPTARPLPGRKTSTGASLSDRVRLRLSPQPPSCSTSSTEGGRLPGTSRERGPSAPSTASWGLSARVGRGLPCEEAPQAPPALLMSQECRSD